MRKITVGAMISVDGVMQAPGGPQEDVTGGFSFGGWTAPFVDEEGMKAIDRLLKEPFALLLGRKTYDIFAGYWPQSGDEMGAMFDRIDKYVASRNPDIELSWQNSHQLGPDAIAALRRLKAEEGPDLVTQGSTDFLNSLLATDLVDEMTLITFPVILGTGKRLFKDGIAPAGLGLIDSMATSTGVVISRYARKGKVETGSYV